MVNGVPMSPSTLARPDGSLKFDAMQFRLDESGYVRASFCRRERLSNVRPVSTGSGCRNRWTWTALSRPWNGNMWCGHTGVVRRGFFVHDRLVPDREVELSAARCQGDQSLWRGTQEPYGNGPEDETARQDTGGVRRGRPLLRKVFRIREHGGGAPCQRLETCYSHNAKNLVRVGDRVKAGDAIATVGRTGRATTEHCHFEVRVNGVPFNSDYIFDHGRHALRKDKLTFTRKSNGTISVRKD